MAGIVDVDLGDGRAAVQQLEGGEGVDVGIRLEVARQAVVGEARPAVDGGVAAGFGDLHDQLANVDGLTGDNQRRAVTGGAEADPFPA